MSKNGVCGIYKITNPLGKIYIGESENIPNRMYSYKIVSCQKQRKLYNSIRKYGWEAHTFEIVEECDFDDLLCKERYWQDFYNVLGVEGLNLKLTNCGDLKGVMSEETKNKISVKNSGSKNGMYGKQKTEEEKQARRNYKHTPENIEKIRLASTRGNNPIAKIVLNTQTGIFYGCVEDASDTIDMKRDTLKQKLNGRRKNDTDFIYV